jgi:hypothetical protein
VAAHHATTLNAANVELDPSHDSVGAACWPQSVDQLLGSSLVRLKNRS